MPSTTMLERRAPAGVLAALLIGVLVLAPPSGATAGGYGELSVDPSPSVASQISVAGVARNATAIDGLRLAAGAHQVCYSALPGYLPPPCEVVQILDGETTTVTPAFVPAGELHVTTTPMQSTAEISVDGVPRDRGEARFPLAAGRHVVCFSDITGLTPPPCEDVALVAGEAVTVVGRYSELNPEPAAPEPPTPGPSEPEIDPVEPTDDALKAHLDLSATVERASGNSPWSAVVTVSSHGSDGRGTVGVEVSGLWETSRPARLATTSCITDAKGACQLEIRDVATGSGNSATFTVDSAGSSDGKVTLTGDTWVTINRNGSVKTG
jgi:hypothetical protein